MIYDIRQITSYAYASTVVHARHALRLMPTLRDGQRVHAAVLDIEPKPARMTETVDFFGNRITAIELAEPHAALTMKLSARIAVEVPPPLDPETTPAWEEVRALAFGSADLGPASPVHYLYPSRQISLDPEIRDYARESFTLGHTTFHCCLL